jgi:SH3-like domain-containing protein
MKAIVLDPQVKVYNSMEKDAVSYATLHENNEIEIGPAKRKAGKLWIPVVLSTGQPAYIPGDTRLALIREGSVMENSVDMHSEPSSESTIKQQIKRNTRLSILQVIKQEGQDWVKVRDTSGSEGYIPGETRFRLTSQRTKANGRRNMITGAMWLVAGLVFIFSENSATTSSGLNLIGYGALAFGAIIFISGLVQFLNAPA